MNNICITGRLGQNPELRYTRNEKQVCRLSVANNTGYGDYEKTTWFTVECWGQNAEFVNKYGTKGRLVSVQGEMVSEEYDGQTYWKIQFAKVEFLDSADSVIQTDFLDEDDIPF